MDQDIHQQLIEQVKNYEMPQRAIDLLTQHPPIIVAGTTAAGKESIIGAIQEKGEGAKVVTHTTRPLRAGEQNGVDYWFVDEPKMLQMIQAGDFIEVKNIHDQQISGSSIAAYQAVLDKSQQPLLIVDVQGVEDITKRVSNLRPIFILPPSFGVWMDRLDQRGHMSHVERVRRLHSALEELETAIANEHFLLVVNDEIARAAQEVTDGIADTSEQQRNRELARQLIDHIKSY